MTFLPGAVELGDVSRRLPPRCALARALRGRCAVADAVRQIEFDLLNCRQWSRPTPAVVTEQERDETNSYQRPSQQHAYSPPPCLRRSKPSSTGARTGPSAPGPVEASTLESSSQTSPR